jgi:hypothetical protein
VWGVSEAIYLTARAEHEYEPDPSSRETLAQFAAAVRGSAFAEDEVEAIVRRVRADLGEGPTRPRAQRDLLALMPYATLAAALPLALVLRRRNF